MDLAKKLNKCFCTLFGACINAFLVYGTKSSLFELQMSANFIAKIGRKFHTLYLPIWKLPNKRSTDFISP